MKTILVIWTIVGYAGTSTSTYERWDWRPIGEFQTVEYCKRAAAVLQTNKFQCIVTGKTR
jgi:hypothetical protein